MTIPSAESPAKMFSSRLGYLLVALALLAPFLGGSTERWSQGVALIGIGLLGLFRPPRAMPTPGLFLVSAGLLIVGAIGLLPAAWFPAVGWKSELLGLGVSLPASVSGQPWLTAEALVLLLGGIVWLLWLAAQSWSPGARRFLFRSYAAGMIVFASVAVLLSLCRMVPPFWSAPAGLGPFPNRNQTGNFFALGALVVLAWAWQSWRRRKLEAVPWLAGFGALMAAVVLANSRAGVALLLGGVAAWVVLQCWFAGSLRSAAIGCSVLLLLGSTFVLYGGKAVERFRHEFGAEEGGLLGFRALIFKDTVGMISQGAWHGVGLGNFHEVFPFFRSATAGEVTFLHPESDWLWAAAELGWVGVALLFVGVGLLWRRAFPLAPNSDRRLRAGALVAGAGFLLHGFVDVSGHRFGTVIPAIFIFSLGLNSPAPPLPRRWVSLGFRACGLLLIAVGLAWVVGSWQGWRVPGAIGVAMAKQDSERLNAAGQFEEAIRVTTGAMPWAPLDWQLYYSRAAAKAHSGQALGALADFRCARRLQPFMEGVTLGEGKIWLAVQPILALHGWQESLPRLPAEKTPALYRHMLALSVGYPGVRAGLRTMAGEAPSLLVAYLAQAHPEESVELLAQLLKIDSSLERLSGSEKNIVFEAMARFMPMEEFEKNFAGHPAWLLAGWDVVARRFAAESRFAEAVQLALAHLPIPAMPELPLDALPEAELRRRILVDPADFASAYTLYRILNDRGDADGVWLVLSRTKKDRPVYLGYLVAKARADQHEWAEAWTELEKLLPLKRMNLQ